MQGAEGARMKEPKFTIAKMQQRDSLPSQIFPAHVLIGLSPHKLCTLLAKSGKRGRPYLRLHTCTGLITPGWDRGWLKPLPTVTQLQWWFSRPSFIELLAGARVSSDSHLVIQSPRTQELIFLGPMVSMLLLKHSFPLLSSGPKTWSKHLKLKKVFSFFNEDPRLTESSWFKVI